MNASINYYKIADFYLKIVFQRTRYNTALVPSLEPFRTESVAEDELLFQITIDDMLPTVDKQQRERIRDFETGNGHTIVDQCRDGGYQYIIKDIKGAECALLIANKGFSQCHCALRGNFDMRKFGLNNALMLTFAFASSKRQTLLIHASLVRHNQRGYAFIAKSGTGKSTQVSMWLRYIPDCDLMNDDNPIVRIIDGTPYIYGGPWSGKTPCYRNVKARLGAVTRIDRAPENSIDKLPPVEAFTSFLPSCSSMKWDPDIYHDICDTVAKVVETTDMYILHCRPDEEAARVCHEAIAL